jgi:protein arginine kinase activator
MGMSDTRCDQCGKQPATVRYTQVDSGHVRKGRLCAACARARGLLDIPPTATSLLQQVLAGAAAKPHLTSGTKTLVCGTCGLAFGEFQSQGRLGCADCYAAFAAELQPLLRQIHGHVEHTGRAPAERPLDAAPRRRLAELRAALDAAVQGEEYERAAELRDAIRALEQTPDSAAGASEDTAGKNPPQEAR